MKTTNSILKIILISAVAKVIGKSFYNFVLKKKQTQTKTN